MIRRLRDIGQALAQAALAPQCPACGRPQGEQLEGVCLRCWDEVDEDRFRAAEQPQAAGATAVWAVGPYRGRLRRVVRCLKFSGLPGLARPLGARLASALEEAGPADAVVPVPLHWRRAWRRGYNQADLLAHAVARAAGLPVERRALRRIRRTDPQSGRTREQRARNVSGAFKARPASVAGLRVLIVDDVMTTGATFRECSRVLVEAGASAVHGAAVARTMTRNDSEGRQRDQ